MNNPPNYPRWFARVYPFPHAVSAVATTMLFSLQEGAGLGGEYKREYDRLLPLARAIVIARNLSSEHVDMIACLGVAVRMLEAVEQNTGYADGSQRIGDLELIGRVCEYTFPVTE